MKYACCEMRERREVGMREDTHLSAENVAGSPRLREGEAVGLVGVLALELAVDRTRSCRRRSCPRSCRGRSPYVWLSQRRSRAQMYKGALTLLSLLLRIMFIVSSLRTTAVKTEDGKHWIINGTKKWITNGTFSHYFTVGCKTEDGFTVILVERSEGVETKSIKTSYVRLASSLVFFFFRHSITRCHSTAR